MFKEVAWDHVRGAWYQDSLDNTWKRTMAKVVTHHLITAAVHLDKTIEKAKEVVAGSARKDDNIRKLDDFSSIPRSPDQPLHSKRLSPPTPPKRQARLYKQKRVSHKSCFPAQNFAPLAQSKCRARVSAPPQINGHTTLPNTTPRTTGKGRGKAPGAPGIGKKHKEQRKGRN